MWYFHPSIRVRYTSNVVHILSSAREEGPISPRGKGTRCDDDGVSGLHNVLHAVIRMLELVLSLFQITSSPAINYHASERWNQHTSIILISSSVGNQACTGSICQSRSSPDARFRYLSSCSHVYIVVWKHWSKLIEFCLCV